MVLGICPAGGKAQRWDCYPKEMLPIGNGKTLLDRTIDALKRGGSSRIMFTTSIEKAQMHINHLGGQVDYRVKTSEVLWNSIAESFSYKARLNLFAMPDTFFPLEIFTDLIPDNFMIGYFETAKPWRFGVLTDGGIKDKEHLPTGTYQAWGVLGWTKKVVDFWQGNQYESHTEAFNAAIKEFGYSAVQMDYYYDFASWSDYQDFVRGEHDGI